MTAYTMESVKAAAAMLGDKKASEEGLKQLAEIVAAEENNSDAFIAVFEHIESVLELCADKQKPVAKAADEVGKAIYEKVPEWSAAACLPKLRKALDGKAKPASKESALEIVEKFCERAPKAVAPEIEWVIHPIVLLMNDIKASVKTKAKATMIALCKASGNKDLEGFLPTIVKANESLKNVDACVEELAGCVFVQNVVAPALSVITPVLWRGLNSKSEYTQRRCCVIIDNMCKLVDDPREGRPLLTEIAPLVKRKAEEISDPDAREMAEKTVLTIEKMAAKEPIAEVDMKEALLGKGVSECMSMSPVYNEYLTKSCHALCKAKNAEIQNWTSVIPSRIAMSMMVEMLMKELMTAGEEKEVEFVDDDVDSPDLYKGSFSLAYGTLTLLRDTKLHLKKNKFYGLLGPQNCGKSTLMRAIANEQVEGFPKRDELITIFVQHQVEEREIEPPSKEWPLGKFNIDLCGMEFVVDTVNNVYMKEPAITLAEAELALGEMGFKNHLTGVNPKAAANMTNPITTYSGGWQVKMQLACAKLVNADILMCDEPTGHLDVKNIAWMKTWLTEFPGSIIATSTNSAFLDEMCTHVVDFSDRKLRQFKSTKGSVLTDYVKVNPEKSAYFELSNKNQKFNFPPPGPLEGVKSRTRAVMKMTGVSFKYPTHEKNTVAEICLSVCMASRIAVVGPNGAGKSTAIKLLIGEITPEIGTVFRHGGLRMAYVAQHAFHHLEKHLTKTAVQYILWRFAGNDDRESLENQSKEVCDDEEKLREQKWCVDPKSGTVRKCVPGEKTDKPEVPDCILNRRKNKAKKYEYEVKWMYKPIEAGCWVERDTLCNMGFEKMVCRKDEQEAAAAGLMSKPLTAPSVAKCLKDFGVDSEAAEHSPISSLSGGQKVKVVLAAAMWQNPHILILDEPTNYLDRDGLGALSLGLKEYGGGVVIISHNMEFAESVCTQKWVMEKDSQGTGRLTEEGEVYVEEDAIGADGDGPDEIVDASGNKIAVNKAKTMSPKEIKKAMKEIEKRLKEHKKKNTLSDAEVWELQDKLQELENELPVDTK